MKGFIDPLHRLEVFELAKKHLEYKKTNINISGVTDSMVAHLIFGLLEKDTKVIITPTERQAKELVDDLKFFEGDKVMFYPSKDLIFYSADVHSNDITRARMEVFNKILQDEQITLVMSVEALVDPLIPIEIIKENLLNYESGSAINLKKLMKQLVYMGYERVDLVESRGQFALRGGLIDIFPVDQTDIIRIELWGDEIDSIRLVNRETQRSIRMLDKTTILPAREIVVNEARVKIAIKNIEADYNKMYKKLKKSDNIEAAYELTRTKENLLDKVKNFGNFNGIESNVFYYYEKSVSILDYFNELKIVMIEPVHIKDRIKGMQHEYTDSMQTRLEKGYLLPAQAELGHRFKRILDEIDNYQTIMVNGLFSSHKVLPYTENIQFNIKSINVYHHNFELMLKDLDYYLKQNYQIVMLTASTTRAKRLKELFDEHEVPCYLIKSFEKEPKKGSIGIAYGNIHKGFEYSDIRFAIMAETDMTGTKKKRKKKKFNGGKKIDHFTELKVGDYIVHEHHGVGVFKGIETIEIEQVSKDFVKIDYRDNGSLYISTSQLSSIQKYIGAEGKAPRLNKLGTQEWKKAKAKVKGAVEELATELIELYAKRENSRGYIYSKDSDWQNEFEELFPYDETDDQINAIKDTKRDMESTKIMDRLICGDVGYGKTEVAIRAAFKAVQDNKQVVYLVPTTILAQQHYNNFVQRMKDFPIRVDMMSRFRTKKEQKQTLEDLSRGLVDIVIGTHRLVSKDVIFKNLGLLIVDEEQRFGVAHKEKIKQMKDDIDVLTLTATPIPRTLHMSMIGVRDMSVLEEPPEERQPIQTYVLEHNDELIKDAIYREISREGQVYYVHNRVKDIDEVASKISAMVPEASVAYAHGQMSERELENIMVDFINGEIDVLVSTTIIETGLDIQNVNTIIIQNADRMGLSQLYQLRGRVGRSSRLAYAYLTYKRDKVLKEVAEKRLKAIKEFTEFGSGFRIAMRDLEIRGAGNILGQSQHGHMDAVGYELYCKMLEQAVNKEQGNEVYESFETTVDISVNAFIPSNYISDEIQKISSYKKIASIRNEKDKEDMQDELIDRYGEPPKSVNNLLEIAYIKGLASSLRVLSIEERNNSIIIEVRQNADIDSSKIPDLIMGDSKRRRFTINEKAYFTLILNKQDKVKQLNYIKSLLQDIKELKYE